MELLERLGRSPRIAAGTVPEQPAISSAATDLLERATESEEAIRRNHLAPRFEVDATGRSVEERAELLDRLGVVTFASGLDPALLAEAGESLFSFAAAVRGGGPTPSGIAAHRMSSAADDYRTMSESETPVISVRGDRDGVDAGMIDIFHVDRLLTDLGGRLRAAMLDAGTIDVLALATGSRVEDRNMNAYINESVTSTRGLHVDSYSRKQFKVFIYLTDVPSLDEGPYCYAPTSHRLPEIEEANRTLATAFGLSATDVRLCPPELPMPLTAPRGTIIISDQGGAHRGFPQVPGARRILGVLNCRVVR